jgi:hypothetical protein
MSPRTCRNAKNPEMIDSRRATVLVVTPLLSSTRCTSCTGRSPARPVR